MRAPLRLPSIAAAIVGIYLAAVPLIFRALNAGVPMWLEQALSLAALPGILSMTIWMPVLRRLGHVDGEWIMGPSFAAYVVLSIAYVAITGLLAYMAVRLRHQLD